jgi:RND family efflux transporter MFP subunit
MKVNRLFLFTSFLPLFIFISGCGNSEESTKEKVTDVQVEQVKPFSGGNAIAYSGTIEETESTPLSFSCIGTVARVLVSDGDFVKKGQLLAVLNDETYKNTYEIALASRKRAEDAYKRLLPMYKNGNIPEIKLVEVETGLEQAKSAALIAKKNVDDCKLYSPVSGVVGKRAIDPGMTALPNITSITIVNIEKVFAKIPIAENDISRIKKGEKAYIMVGALGNEKYQGIVEEIGVVADPLAHTYKIKIGITNKNNRLKPGMICAATLDQFNKSKGLFVPSRAVLTDEQGRYFIYAVINNKAVRKFVKTGKLLTDGVEITEGLSESEQIVVAGQQKLADNSTVNIVTK